MQLLTKTQARKNGSNKKNKTTACLHYMVAWFPPQGSQTLEKQAEAKKNNYNSIRTLLL